MFARSSSSLRRAGRGHRRADPAPGVGLARHPRGELGRAIAGEHEMRVRIDEAGQHRPSTEVVGLIGGRRVRGAAHPGDRRTIEDERSIGDLAERVVLRGQQADVVQQRRRHDVALAAAFISFLCALTLTSDARSTTSAAETNVPAAP